MDDVSDTTPVPFPQVVTRRNFYIGAIYGMGAAISAAVGLPVLGESAGEPVIQLAKL